MKSLTSKIGIVIIAVLIIAALFAPWIAPHSPGEYHLDKSFAGSSLEYPLGNDADGRDILSRIIYGTRVSLGIGLVVVSISLVIGCIVGMAAGYSGGYLDKIFSFISDVFLAFPGFLFAVAVAAFLEPSVINVMIILSIKGWVSFARLVRGQTLAIKEREFIVAGRATGLKLPRLFFKHLFPNMVGPIVVNASFGMAGVIMIESSLSFLGLGVPVTTPSWGVMLDQGTKYLLIAPHLSIYPGIAIALVVLGFNFLGDGLRDMLAPKNR
ncbi:MAG: ABC transporter permease [Deltaproteobacteria bacterium]|jgi:peptide/nickel transport system permease protein|nr:ABC transporter permease [Deltaproteobacteria bacterium]